jgi:ergothioneine biosynthesis protein EgtB
VELNEVAAATAFLMSLSPPRTAPTSDPTHPSPSRQAWAERYRAVRALTEELCQPLEPEDYVVQSMPDASPAKWHLAHTSWFFETFVLKPGLAGYEGSDPHHAYLFNSYYNAVGPMHCRALRGMISRPTVAETYRYRQQTDAAMAQLFEHANDDEWQRVEAVVELGLHHEQQHQELLLTDLKHMFALNPLWPVYRAAPARPAGNRVETEPLRWHEYAEGVHEIGYGGDGFCFDNETPRHRQYLQPFRLASRLVTNGEYQAFIEDGGYSRPEYWLSLGWAAVREQQWQAPLYWIRQDDQWQAYTLHGLQPVDPAEPVCHVSFFEADAFARWAGGRLPTEAEWEVAAANHPIQGNFVDSRRFHPTRAATDGPGPGQLFGDVWEWTRSDYAPYPGYRAAPGAIGEYNGKFMCNQYVLRGGSCATSRTHLRRTYRNFFPPDRRWQFTGLRLAQDVA